MGHCNFKLNIYTSYQKYKMISVILLSLVHLPLNMEAVLFIIWLVLLVIGVYTSI